MLITERLERCDFSNSERIIIDYILEKKLEIANMTAKAIAEATYTSPSTLIRIAHKMNFDGWNELKQAYLKETEYLESQVSDVDANIPFKRNETIMNIAQKIAVLEKESIDNLQKAIQIIRKSDCIHLFAVSNNLLITQEFKHQMSRIKKRVEIHALQSEIVFNACLSEPTSCALIVSYSGETDILNRCIRALKANSVPIIAITNIGDNTTARLSDCVLKICTREKLYSKISTYSTDTAIVYLLNVIYSCVFALNYDYNLNLKIESSRMIENGRFSTLNIIKEDENENPR